jgi:beta-galactosidase
VRNGGVLIASFKSFVADRNLTVYSDMQPHGMACFGMSYNQFTTPGRTTLEGHAVKYFMELLKPEGAEAVAHYEHKYWGKYAAVTKNSYGNGTAYYVGCFTEKEYLKTIYQKAADDAGITIDFEELAWPLIARSGVGREGKKLHYVMNYSEQEQAVTCPYDGAVDLLTGAIYAKGERIFLSDWNLVILEEKS